MSGDRSNEVFIEGTQFYRKSPLSQALKTALLILVGLILLSVLAFWAVIDTGARQAYKEARDVRKALRAVGTEYYGYEGSIYDPSRVDGLTEGAADRIALMSTRTGEVILYSWDEVNNTPVQFEYRKGMYRVIYTDYGSGDGYSAGVEGDFHVYYSFEILTFEEQ